MTRSKMPSISAAQMRNMAQQKMERENQLAGFYTAQEIYVDLMAEVDAFEKNLPENAEIGLRLANFGEAAQIHIRAVSFENPYLIKFHGLNHEQQEVMLIQHVSQLNFMLSAISPVEEEPFRIGFNVEREEDG